jgi:hypothetical protein
MDLKAYWILHGTKCTFINFDIHIYCILKKEHPIDLDPFD